MTASALRTHSPALPVLPRDALETLSLQISPVMVVHHAFRWYARSPGDVHSSYLSAPQGYPVTGALVFIGEVRTLHAFNDDGFAPTVAEVLAQIPLALRERACAFHTVSASYSRVFVEGAICMTADTEIFARA